MHRILCVYRWSLPDNRNLKLFLELSFKKRFPFPFDGEQNARTASPLHSTVTYNRPSAGDVFMYVKITFSANFEIIDHILLVKIKAQSSYSIIQFVISWSLYTRFICVFYMYVHLCIPRLTRIPYIRIYIHMRYVYTLTGHPHTSH